MQKEDFDKLVPECAFDECFPHDIQKLYDLGTQDGYGCTKCGVSFPNKEMFKNSKQYVLHKFSMEYSSLRYVDRDFLIHRGYTDEAIQMMISEGILCETTGYDSDSAFANTVRYRICL